MRVTIEREVWHKGKRPEKRYTWERAWSALVLYADAKVMLLRSAGSHQKFTGGGHPSMWGHDPKHPDVVRLNLPRDSWGRSVLGRIRIAPRSLARLLAEVKRAGSVSRSPRLRKPKLAPGRVRLAKAKDYHHETYHEGLARESREAARRSGKRTACKPPTRSPRRA